MKSNLFSKTDAFREDRFSVETFKKDLADILSIDIESIKSLVQILPDYIYEKLDINSEKIKSSIIEKTKITYSQFDSFYSISKYFIAKFLPEGDAEDDKIEDIISDLIKLNLAEKNKSQELSLYLNEIRKISLDKINNYLLRESAISKSPNRLKVASSNIDFRPIFEEEHSFGEEIKNYNPKCIGLVPLATINLHLAGSHMDEFSFTCEIDCLKRFIQQLENTIIELEKSKEFLRIE